MALQRNRHENSALHFAMDKLGLRQADVARLLGVAPLTVYRWKHGMIKTHPAANRLLGIALEVPGAMQWLLNTVEVVYDLKPKSEAAPQTLQQHSGKDTAPWNQ